MKVADPIAVSPSSSSPSGTVRRAPGSRRSIVRAVAAGVVGVVFLGACASDPGPKRVAEDIIRAEAFENPDLDEECLLRELDKFSDDDLRAIQGDLDSSDAARNERGEAALLAYQRSLEVCL